MTARERYLHLLIRAGYRHDVARQMLESHLADAGERQLDAAADAFGAMMRAVLGERADHGGAAATGSSARHGLPEAQGSGRTATILCFGRSVAASRVIAPLGAAKSHADEPGRARPNGRLKTQSE